jgi:hypothetical protein
MRSALGMLAALAPAVAACSGPTVRLSTPTPLAVDITMRVDIYQHAPAAGQTDDQSAGEGPEARRRARMAEIQTLKNSRLVGENRRGLLTVLETPPGEYGTYVERTAAAENTDRTALMNNQAAAQRQPLDRVQAAEARLWRERSFPGEWIEVQEPDGVSRWQQKRPAQAPPSSQPVEGP